MVTLARYMVIVGDDYMVIILVMINLKIFSETMMMLIRPVCEW